MQYVAIITADIVNSTLLNELQEKALMQSIKSILATHKFEFYRGDSFQVIIKEYEKALKIALQIRMAARKIETIYDVRTSIGIGEIKPGIKKLSTSTGEAFTLSGRAFDEFKNSEKKLSIITSNEFVNLAFRAISSFIDYLFGNLTSKQAEVLFVLLNENTQLKAAKKLKKSQSTINKHIQASGWYEIMNMLELYEQIIIKWKLFG